MAEFCKEHAEELGLPVSILAEAPIYYVWDLCESCGWGWFDREGKRVETPAGHLIEWCEVRGFAIGEEGIQARPEPPAPEAPASKEPPPKVEEEVRETIDI